MRLVCPECLGTLVPDGAGSSRCETHGGQYQVLFLRSPAPPVIAQSPVDAGVTAGSISALTEEPPPPVIDSNAVPPVAYTLVPGTACYKHRSMEARYACCQCGTPICGTCAFPEGDGLALCPECIVRRMSATAQAQPLATPEQVEAPIPVGAHCVQHPNLPAVRQCKVCGKFMCATCDFSLPGNIHVCPACAAAPRKGLSPKRKKLLIASFALAVWATMGMTALLAGVFAMRSEVAQAAMGTLLIFVVLGPAVCGLGFALSSRDRRLENPPAIMIAIVWNALLVGSFLLLCIIGLASH